MRLRWLAGTSVAALLLMAGQASATGPGGWDHAGQGATVGSPALNGTVSALNADDPSKLYVGGNFTAAGGVAGADRIASWNGSVWRAVSSLASGITNGAVNAIAYDPVTHYVYAGGTFSTTPPNASPADFLAVWNGTTWAPFCAAIPGTVYALQIIGRKLYVGGAFAAPVGLPSGQRLVRCDLDTGAASSTVDSVPHAFSGTVYALSADSNGRLYAGGGFTDLGGDSAADNVAYLDASGTGWHAMGAAAKAGCLCSVDDYVRSLTAVGTDVYVGTDTKDVAGIVQADHVARWDGAAWHAVGANTAGADGWFPTSAFIYGMAHDATNVYATGSFQNANLDPTADFIASFDGTNWHPLGSDGAGNGPWSGNGLAVGSFNQRLYAGGNFTSAGGDTQAKYLAAYPGYYQLTVVFAGTGSGYIQTQQLPCRATCSQSYPPGTALTLGAASDAESKFLGWSGAGCTGTSPCHVTMNADTTVTVNFTGIPACSTVSGYTATGGVPRDVHMYCRDANGNPLTYSIVSGPSHGTLGPVSADGGVTYTPTVGFTGYDRFTYTGTAADGVASPQFVSINVTDPGYTHSGDNVALKLGKLTPSMSGALSLSARNGNTFTVRAVSVKVTSLAAVAAATGRAHKKVVTFLTSSKAVTVKAGRTATLKGRVKARQLAQLKRLRHVRVRITVVLKTPNGTRSTVTSTGTLRAPK
ncbi:MAG: hypothetical protein JWN32_3101 [Solirubrobacterales bacterium]|nr:hypothetical protein [Solirubrobacterales bacterium]